MVLESFWIPAVAAGLRSIAGWVENALEDGEISRLELGLLLATVLKIGVIALGLQFGLGLDPVTSSGVAVAADFGLNALRKTD